MHPRCPRHAGTIPIHRTEPSPLIVTATLDAVSFAILDGMRRRHFPAHLNFVPAHACLFHHLPGEAIASVSRTLDAACRARTRFALEADGAMFLGRGVAFRYKSDALAALRGALARNWAEWLTPQDRQGFRPHVTVQNKVDPAEARRLFDHLRAAEVPACRVEGLTLWRYLGGPWERVSLFPFADGMAQ